MVQVDRRMVARRRQVAEVQARSALAKLVILLALGAVVAGVVWLFRSPLMSVQQVVVEGIDPAEIQPILGEQGVVAGRPLVTLRPARIESALLANPMVKTASVALDCQQTVQVSVQERLAVAWADLGGTWARVGVDGVVISTAPQPAAGLPRLQVGGVGDQPTVAALAGLAFLAELHPSVAHLATVWLQGDELWATLPELTVRLGRPADMEAKARALEAILVAGVANGSTINLLAPTRPAVLDQGGMSALSGPSGQESKPPVDP
ncbi:MAG TPA: FtsQ-type POTRA domain-containing protein [Acidimicrobiia bacterium]|nr:FtsQ-type POTRA domain-containing protein [Acidimicrobiia bacterium]